MYSSVNVECLLPFSDFNNRDSARTNVTLRRIRKTLLTWKFNKDYIVCSVFVALGTQHSKCMRRVILSSVACPPQLIS